MPQRYDACCALRCLSESTDASLSLSLSSVNIHIFLCKISNCACNNSNRRRASSRTSTRRVRTSTRPRARARAANARELQAPRVPMTTRRRRANGLEWPAKAHRSCRPTFSISCAMCCSADSVVAFVGFRSSSRPRSKRRHRGYYTHTTHDASVNRRLQRGGCCKAASAAPARTQSQLCEELIDFRHGWRSGN